MRKGKLNLILILACFLGAGCAGLTSQTKLNPTSFDYLETEPKWIQDGEPIEFEGELWYPTDEIEILLDSEVYLMGEYKGTQYFIEKVDVRPYTRLFTKFGHNKFRIFSRVRQDD